MTSDSGSVPLDKTRRKRLKVLSACGECRRKKTKCNGEKPCAGCIKAKVDCKYVHTKCRGATSTAMSASRHSVSSVPPGPLPVSSTVNSVVGTATPLVSSPPPTLPANTTMRYTPPAPADKPTPSMEAIEDRLCAIEDILRALLKAGKLPHSPSSYHSELVRAVSPGIPGSAPEQDVYMQGGSYGDGVHHPRAVHPTQFPQHHHQQQQQHHAWVAYDDSARLSHHQGMMPHRPSVFAPTPRRPTWTASQEAVHLPPLHYPNQQPPLTTSCSTSSMSSSSSTSTASSATSSSPGPAIRNLLNDEDSHIKLPGVANLPTPPLTATFHKAEGDAYFQHHDRAMSYSAMSP